MSKLQVEMFSWCVSNSKTICNSSEKTVQLFHDMATKGVNQLLGDPNSEASQWLKGLLLSIDNIWSKLCTSRGFSVGANDLSLMKVNFKVNFKK